MQAAHRHLASFCYTLGASPIAASIASETLRLTSPRTEADVVAAWLLALKFEETFVFVLDEVVEDMPAACTTAAVVRAERRLMSALRHLVPFWGDVIAQLFRQHDRGMPPSAREWAFALIACTCSTRERPRDGVASCAPSTTRTATCSAAC